MTWLCVRADADGGCSDDTVCTREIALCGTVLKDVSVKLPGHRWCGEGRGDGGEVLHGCGGKQLRPIAGGYVSCLLEEDAYNKDAVPTSSAAFRLSDPAPAITSLSSRVAALMSLKRKLSSSAAAASSPSSSSSPTLPDVTQHPLFNEIQAANSSRTRAHSERYHSNVTKKCKVEVNRQADKTDAISGLALCRELLAEEPYLPPSLPPSSPSRHHPRPPLSLARLVRDARQPAVEERSDG